jgi:hypothetical protein
VSSFSYLISLCILLQVTFRKEDLTISCECMRFEQFGLLCRHAFYVLRLCDIREFPKKYVLRRWTREAIHNSPLQSTLRPEEFGNNGVAIEAVIREIRFANDYIINRLVGDTNQLCLYRDHLKSYMSTADEVQVVAPPPSRRDRFAAVTEMGKHSNAKVRIPIKTKTKGCGSHKRLKSGREIAISQAGKKARECGFCKKPGHNQRTCPLDKQSIKDKVDANGGSGVDKVIE